MTHRFVWYKCGLYKHWHNRLCRILKSRLGKAHVEFENGEQCITSVRALRKLKQGEDV